MVSRIEVIPTEVRGYGNIIIPKTSSDFIGKYNDIYTNINGDFVLAYGGILLKITATVSDSIKGLTANLNVIVTKRDDNTPIEDIIVGCKVDGTSLTNETTDENGECDFSWTPGEVGDSTILITIEQQDDYAGLTETKEITIGLLLSFNSIMNDLRLEDDEYVADISQQVESRTQLNPFVKDVWVAKGGEPIVDEYGIVHLAKKGDLIVEQEAVSQLTEYDNVLFEGDVELLTGAVYDMSVTEDYELVINCLERDDIIGAPSYDGVSLTSDKSILSYADSDTCTLTAQLLDGSSSASVSGVSVEFFKGSTSLGTATTNASGVATKTYSASGYGDLTFSAEIGALSDDLLIEDCLRYDDASTDKASDYNYIGLSSLTHSTDHYEAERTSTTNFYSPIYVDETLPTDFEMSVDINAGFSSGNNHQEMLTFGTNHPTTYSGTSEIGIVSSLNRYGLFKRISGTFTSYATNGTISANAWYTFIVKRNGTSVTAKILNNQGTEIHNATQTISEAPNYNKWNLIVGDTAYTLKWKNLKIKPL